MQQFGDYQLIHQLAVGGMAEVFLAKVEGVEGFEKYVALKMIHPRLGANAEFVRMLVNEAKIAAILTHQNIAQTLDLGCVDGRYYIAMEYVDGIDVSNLIKASAFSGLMLPIDICALVMTHVLVALDHAHNMRDDTGRPLGIIHRDVSPDNVLISSDGIVKLVDFGIAKATSVSPSVIGAIKGKWLYMSPEQTRGDPLDARADIYSAGAVFYEMLTGRRLYEDNGLEELVALIRAGAYAPPSFMRSEIPPQLEQIIVRSLAVNRDDRYPSAEAFAHDLQRFLQAYSPRVGTVGIATLVNTVRERAGMIAPPPPPPPPPPPEPVPAAPRTRASTQLGIGANSAAPTRLSTPNMRAQTPVPEAPPSRASVPVIPNMRAQTPVPEAPPSRASVPVIQRAEPPHRTSKNVIVRQSAPRIEKKADEPVIEMSADDPTDA